MITKFDSLYAGHTDLDNIGYGGTPINERRYSNAHLATALSKAECATRRPTGHSLRSRLISSIQGGSMRALEFMAKHGIHGMVGGGCVYRKPCPFLI